MVRVTKRGAETRTAVRLGGDPCSFCYFTLTRMKNESPTSEGGEAVNFALPSTGVSKVIVILSDENADGVSDAARRHLAASLLLADGWR